MLFAIPTEIVIASMYFPLFERSFSFAYSVVAFTREGKAFEIIANSSPPTLFDKLISKVVVLSKKTVMFELHSGIQLKEQIIWN